MKSSSKKLNLKKEQIAKLNTVTQSVNGGTGIVGSDYECQDVSNNFLCQSVTRNLNGDTDFCSTISRDTDIESINVCVSYL